MFPHQCPVLSATSTFHQFEVHRFLPFGIMAGLALGAAMMCMTLPETHNQPTIENLVQDGYEKDENRNAKDGGDEETTLM